MTMMSDLSHDLVEEILSKVPITSLGAVRSTCKAWNTLSKNRVVCNGEATHQFLGLVSHGLCSVRFNLHGNLNEDGREFVFDPSVKPIGNLLNKVEISDIFSCDGLLLCVPSNHSAKLVVWNPYLGQTRWIQTANDYGSPMYAFGYDNNKNHKILRGFTYINYYEIYDLKSSSWNTFYVDIKWKIHQRGTSLNGNTYFLTNENIYGEGYDFLRCFDFTTETFGQLIDMPPNFLGTGILSCVKEEKLAALYKRCDTHVMEIWVTTKIHPNAASWSKFLKIDMKPPTGFDFDFDHSYDSFFIAEEKKVAVVFSLRKDDRYNTTYIIIIGDNRYLKIVDLAKVVNPHEESMDPKKYMPLPLVYSSSYLPTLVQINQIAGR